MLKNKLKVVLLLLLVVTFISSVCLTTSKVYATDTTLAAEEADEEVENEVDDEVDDEELLEEEDYDYGDVDLTTDGISAETVNHDLYLMGDNVKVEDVVDGNVYVMANEVTITGEIGGDVFVLANKVNLDGAYIYCSLFAACNELTVNGVICDAYVTCQTFNLAEDGYIYRDLKIAANTINIDGKVRRDVYASGENFNINSENGTLVGGNFTYSSNAELTIPEDIILGEVKYEKSVEKEVKVLSIVAEQVIDVVNNLVYALILVALVLWLAPKFTEKVSNMDTKKAAASVGVGFLVPIVAVIAIVLLLISGIASKLGLALTLLFIIICMSGTAVASIFFGSLFAKLVKWEGKPKFVLACGIAVLAIWLIGKIPFIGGFIVYLVSLLGIGAVIINAIPKKEKTEKAEVKTEETAKKTKSTKKTKKIEE